MVIRIKIIFKCLAEKNPKQSQKEENLNNKMTADQLFGLPLTERLKLKSKVKENIHKKELKLDESQNLHQDNKKRKRDDFDIFNENPIPKMDGDRKVKKIIIGDEESEKDFSTNVDDRFKF